MNSWKCNQYSAGQRTRHSDDGLGFFIFVIVGTAVLVGAVLFHAIEFCYGAVSQ